jgi:L,D-transpeptidase ErfK/SrfK
VINLAERRLYYFDPESRSVVILPIAIGREGAETPLGVTQITQKIVDPSWTVPKTLLEELAAEGRILPPIVPPGPDNPLGDRALILGWPGYLIHGTNRPYGVGLRASSGCIRVAPESMRALFERIKKHTPVRVEHSPVKVGWFEGALFVESHRPLPEYGTEADLREQLVAAVQAALARNPDSRMTVPVEQALRMVMRFQGRPVLLWSVADSLPLAAADSQRQSGK